MRPQVIIILLLSGIYLASCGWNLNAPDDGNGVTDPNDQPTFKNSTSEHLPSNLTGQSNGAKAVDIDNDGDWDIVIALGFESNRVLVNNGNGVFNDQTSSRLTTQSFNSQDITVADFNSDGNPDLFFASEQNQASEFSINNDFGTFTDLSNRVPVSGNFTSAEALDVDEDGSMDLFIGNRGQNILLANSGNAFFNNQTSQRLPQISDLTFDVAQTDLTGNGLPDFIVANQGPNLTLINTGSGFFENQSSNRIPYINAVEESHSITARDIDGDNDKDIYFGNTGFSEDSNPQDRLLINDGNGFFSDQTADRLPTITSNTSDAALADIDNDGDLDIVVGNYNGGLRVFINNGSGFFEDHSEDWLPEDFSPFTNDVEIADFNGDGLLDIYIAIHNKQDQLLIQQKLD
ncbi:VCBS repeat-containing protein [Fodinibius sp. Rm-B-1B1-1]|uniref:FG-GAP repeat domain-containing protein n=1 Tax=Fodinibius alkaliphilus TaxID=3140241 RepID=UPI00315A7A96